jgi:sulfite dehydrogenase (cytochrome) subunit B
MRVLLLTLDLLGPSAAAYVGEDAIKLKTAPGLDVVEANCIGCHSLDYPVMNSPFLDEKGWTAEVTKMIKAYGAPVSEADVPKIIAYLSANYGKR